MMKSSDEDLQIREEDIEARPIERRTFLGRFGVAAGMASLVGLAACSGESDSCDTDGDPADADPSDPVDADGDSCDSD